MQKTGAKSQEFDLPQTISLQRLPKTETALKKTTLASFGETVLPIKWNYKARHSPEKVSLHLDSL